MKKLLLSLGSAAAVIAPVVSVISCNNGGASSNSSDKNTKTNTSNSGVQASEHKYPELTDRLRNEFRRSGTDVLNYFKSKGEYTYFDQFKKFANDKLNYVVFDQHSQKYWVAPYHEVYDYFHSLAPKNFSYLDN